jgi:hypothetical protein
LEMCVLELSACFVASCSPSLRTWYLLCVCVVDACMLLFFSLQEQETKTGQGQPTARFNPNRTTQATFSSKRGRVGWKGKSDATVVLKKL